MPSRVDKDHTTETVRIFDRHAQRYAGKYMDVSVYHTALDHFLALLPTGSEVLELACGPGNVTRYLLSRRPDLRILATDLAPAMLELAKANNPAATFGILDQRAIATLEGSFQGIVCAFGLPYLNAAEAGRLFGDASHMLRPGGALFLSTMEGDPANSGWEGPDDGERIFMNYHRAVDLEDALNTEGFLISHRSRASYASPHGVPVTYLMLVARLPTSG
jgi:SAM-dependent methyltransferase